jgi:SAM-dependent methyltransferase
MDGDALLLATNLGPEPDGERSEGHGGVVSVFENDVESWELLAQTDPYWAVLSSEEFRDGALTPSAEQKFWDSGQLHIDHVFAVIRNELDPGFQPRVCLDFGCGIGRNLVPLAERADRAIGLDASSTMVRRAADRLASRQVENGELLVVDRQIDAERVTEWGPVDFIHSVLVFQHIVAEDGFALFDQLLDLLAAGGHGFVQFHCQDPGSELVRAVRELRLRHRWFNSLVVRSRLRPFTDSLVMLYEYDVLELLRHLAAHRIADVVVERTEAGPGGYDVRLYFSKFAGTGAEFDKGGRQMTVRLRP